MKHIATVFLLILPLAITQERVYCFEDLCHTDKLDHVTCDTSTPPDDCLAPELMHLSSSRRDQLLLHFNRLRVKIATGEQCEDNFECPHAARMAEMHWDDELQYLAELYVKRCKFTDGCVNTNRFSNVAIINRTIYHPNHNLNLEVQRNFEYQNVPKFTPELIKSYNATGNNHRFWTQTADIAVDKNYLLGCAIFKYNNLKGQRRALLTCLLPTKAVEGQPLFQIGEEGSACETLSDEYLDVLCSTEEHYDVN